MVARSLSAGSDGYSVNGRNQYTAVDGTTPTYDANQNATSMLGQSFGYDALNQLTSAGSNTFAFDPAKRLYRSVGSADTRFVYDGVVAAAEYNGSGSLTRRHVPGMGLGTALTYDGSTTQYLITDERGSVIALADGSSVTVNSYDEFGTPGSGNAGRFQYTGQMWLPEAGLYHYRARAYMPQIGRFLQTDPIGYAVGANLYAYVGNDPINFTDPFGLQAAGNGPFAPEGSTCYRGGWCDLPITQLSPVYVTGRPSGPGGNAGGSNGCTTGGFVEFMNSEITTPGAGLTCGGNGRTGNIFIDAYLNLGEFIVGQVIDPARCEIYSVSTALNEIGQVITIASLGGQIATAPIPGARPPSSILRGARRLAPYGIVGGSALSHLGATGQYLSGDPVDTMVDLGTAVAFD